METIHETNSSYGQTITNLHLRNSTSSIAGKRWQSEGEDCINDDAINAYTGVFIDDVTSEQILNCRTEKDKHVQLNCCAAGILAGIWPCGIISELYISESKSQVYGN